MKKNKTEIILLVDRSGSMMSIKTDMEGALSSFLQKQAELPGECFVSLYTFDTELERPVFCRSLATTPPAVHIDPRGGTALYDAACQVIDEAGKRLAATAEADRPETVLFVIVTDGEENSSRTFKESDVKSRIELQRDAYKWKFTFLGANQDAITAARGLGIGANQSITYAASSAGVSNVTGSLHAFASCVRSCSTTDAAYSVEDRKTALQN